MSRFMHGGQVQANGIRQHYLRYGGSGPALILVPGITSPAITWGFVAEVFAQHFDTWVLDVRGRGLSSSGEGLDYGMESCADDINAFADALGLTRYEYLLLKTLLEHPGHVLSRPQLMARVWRGAPETLERTVDAHVKSLRAKLRAVDEVREHVQTHRGLGYSLLVAGAVAP